VRDRKITEAWFNGDPRVQADFYAGTSAMPGPID
jgi:hypothetical protein